jgi:hypothetical protein
MESVGQIQECKNDQKIKDKRRNFMFDVLDVLFEGMEASPM